MLYLRVFNTTLMKRNLIQLGIPSIALISLLSSCGEDPKGKFQDDGAKKTASVIDTSARYLKINPATAWDASWSKENIVVYHWRAEPDNMHPTNGKSNPRRVIMDYTQRFLVGADVAKLELRPDLVKAMPTISPDGLSYTYELRDEPTWDDGSPLTIEDIEFSIKANKCPQTNNPHAKPYFESINNFVKDPSNPKKFTIVMTKKYIQNVAVFGDVPIMQRKFMDPSNTLSKYTLAQFSDPAFSSAKHEDLEKWGTEFNDAKYGRDLSMLNGLGAYKITAWEPKERIELTRKPNHWTSKVQNPDMYDVSYPEKIIFKINVDDNSISLEFGKQVIDASTWVSTNGLVKLQTDANFNKNYHSAFVQNFDYQYIGMNMKAESVNRTPFFSDKTVRKAMALLVPIDKVNQAYLQGKAIRMTSLVTPTKTTVYNTDLKPVPFDVEKAKKLLDEAGWKDSDGDNIRDKMIDGKKTQFSFELMTIQGNAVTENIAKEIVESMKSAGVKCNSRSVEFVTFYELVQHHNFDMYMGAWSTAFVSEDYKQVWHTSSWAGEGSNYVGFGNPQTDALIDSIRVTLEDSVRIPMEKRLQALVYDEQPYIFMFQLPRKTVIHKRFDHPDMYFEKPGVNLSNLRMMSPGNMAKPTNTI